MQFIIISVHEAICQLQQHNMEVIIESVAGGNTACGPLYGNISSDPVMVQCPAYESLPIVMTNT